MLKIVLVGYMGSGKSAVSKSLVNLLNLNLIDLDSYIEEKENLKIPEIFKLKGEIYFRKMEKDCLNELLSNENSFILSVGGGTPCFSGNMELILQKSVSIYLKTSIATLYDRLIHEKAQRPLIAQIADENLKEFIAKHLFERAAFYEQCSHSVVVDNKSLDEIAKEIEKLVS